MRTIVSVCLFFGLFFINSNKVQAQHFEFGLEYGFSSYFGDLAPYSSIPSAALNTNSFGFYGGIGNEWGTVFVNYTSTEIFASDSESPDENRQLRNLDFRSPIKEFGATIEFNLLRIFKKKHTALRPLFITGISVFKFNPQTKYNEQWIDLQPLGTEGQGALPGKDKYSLKELSIPFGAGLKYEMNNVMWVGCGFKVRMTFTDYLDDVSTVYLDKEYLESHNGALAAKLAFRSDELDESLSYPSGSLRGNPSENDWYMTTYLSMGFRLQDDPTQPPKNRIRKHKTKCFWF